MARRKLTALFAWRNASSDLWFASHHEHDTATMDGLRPANGVGSVDRAMLDAISRCASHRQCQRAGRINLQPSKIHFANFIDSLLAQPAHQFRRDEEATAKRASQ
ncbi:MAG: hypothetical protein ABIP61_02805 [Burkholderiaceae bacterium]